jgi:hypothetical protein
VKIALLTIALFICIGTTNGSESKIKAESLIPNNNKSLSMPKPKQPQKPRLSEKEREKGRYLERKKARQRKGHYH